MKNIIAQTAEKIDALRCALGYSIRALSVKAGISKTTLVEIIQGEKIPNIQTLQLICDALEISLSDFFNQNEEVLMLRGKESILIKIYRELSPMSQDTLIKLAKCMK